MKAASGFSIDGALVLILDFDTISAAVQQRSHWATTAGYRRKCRTGQQKGSRASPLAGER
jgi:hypothetical protein